jgi:hypothetical protein
MAIIAGCGHNATKSAQESKVSQEKHHRFIMTAEENNPNESGDDETKQRKRKERLEQNRISARESRKRKKTMIEELQRTVITLSRENKELNERNEVLRRQLIELGTKVRASVIGDLLVSLGTSFGAPMVASRRGQMTLSALRHEKKIALIFLLQYVLTLSLPTSSFPSTLILCPCKP